MLRSSSSSSRLPWTSSQGVQHKAAKQSPHPLPERRYLVLIAERTPIWRCVCLSDRAQFRAQRKTHLQGPSATTERQAKVEAAVGAARVSPIRMREALSIEVLYAGLVLTIHDARYERRHNTFANGCQANSAGTWNDWESLHVPQSPKQSQSPLLQSRVPELLKGTFLTFLLPPATIWGTGPGCCWIFYEFYQCHRLPHEDQAISYGHWRKKRFREEVQRKRTTRLMVFIWGCLNAQMEMPALQNKRPSWFWYQNG